MSEMDVLAAVTSTPVEDEVWEEYAEVEVKVAMRHRAELIEAAATLHGDNVQAAWSLVEGGW